MVALPAVYEVAGSPDSAVKRVLAAVLSVGKEAVASHETAAQLWSLDGFNSLKLPVIGGEGEFHVHITSTHRRRSPAHWVRLHRTIELTPTDIGVVGGVPVTSVSRTIRDLAPIVSREELERAIDSAMRRRLISATRLRWEVKQEPLHARGRGNLRKAMQDSTGHSESFLETKLLQTIRRYRLPPPEAQYEIRRVGTFIARVDFAYPEHRIAIEVDGFAFHSDRRAFRVDRERQNKLVALGWVVLRATDAELKRPSRLMSELSSLLSRAEGPQSL